MSQIYKPLTSAGPIPPIIPTQFTTDSGIAIPALNNINIITPGGGTEGIATSGAGSTITITLTEVAAEYINVTAAMSPYTVTATDYFISCDSTLGPIVINLPDSPAANRQFVIKDRLGQTAVNNIIVKSLTGAATIDTQASYTFVDNFESLECLFHGTNYEVF